MLFRITRRSTQPKPIVQYRTENYISTQMKVKNILYAGHANEKVTDKHPATAVSMQGPVSGRT